MNILNKIHWGTKIIKTCLKNHKWEVQGCVSFFLKVSEIPLSGHESSQILWNKSFQGGNLTLMVS